MTREELLQKINNFIEEGPFTDEEVEEWQESASSMKEADLVNFFDLIKERSRILFDANKLFIKIAEDTLKFKEKRKAEIPKEIYIADMQIQDLTQVIKKNLIALVKNEKQDIFVQIDQFFKNSSLVGDNVVGEFVILAKAILFNKEIFTKEPVSVGRWLVMYNAFKDKDLRKSIDRINFAHQNKVAKKLDDTERKTLLKILKFYDFLLDPSNVDIGSKVGGLSKLEQRKSYQEQKQQVQKETPVIEEVPSSASSAKIAELDAVRHINENMVQEESLSDAKQTENIIASSPQPVVQAAPEIVSHISEGVPQEEDLLNTEVIESASYVDRTGLESSEPQITNRGPHQSMQQTIAATPPTEYGIIEKDEKKETSSLEKVSLSTDSAKLAGSNAANHLDNSMSQDNSLSAQNKVKIVSGPVSLPPVAPKSAPLKLVKPKPIQPEPIESKPVESQLVKPQPVVPSVAPQVPAALKLSVATKAPSQNTPKTKAPQKKPIPLQPVFNQVVKPKPATQQPTQSEPNKNQQKIEELQELLKQYAGNSLVQKAITEEINKLSVS